MKTTFIILFAILPMAVLAQKENQLQEITVIASRTTNNAEGYVTNLRGTDIAKGKPAVNVLPFLPNISHENGNFKINGLAVSEIYVDGVKLSDISELDNIPGEMIEKVQVQYIAGAWKNLNFTRLQLSVANLYLLALEFLFTKPFPTSISCRISPMFSSSTV